VLDLLQSLLDKSLVRLRAPVEGAPRFTMLETIREYAVEHLGGRSDAAVLRRRHAEYYLRLAETAEPEVQRGAAQRPWLERLEAERDNLRAALHWARDQGEGAIVLRLGAALVPFWSQRGGLHEGRRWLEAALATCEREHTVPAALRAKALLATAIVAFNLDDVRRSDALYEASRALFAELGDTPGIVAALDGLALSHWHHGDYRRATAVMEEQLGLERERGNRAGIARALNSLGYLAHDVGDFERAFALLGESLALYHTLGDRSGVAKVLSSLAVTACHQGDLHRATAWATSSLGLSQELGDQPSVAGMLGVLGSIAVYQGDGDRAARLLDEAQEVYRQLQDGRSDAVPLRYQGRLAQDRGDWAGATALYRESLARARETGRRWEMAAGLEWLGEVADAQDRPRQAARLWAAAEALREQIGAPLPPVDGNRYEVAVAHARVALGDEAWGTAWVEGRAMTLEQAVAYALDDAD
jgi:tetratricopeptide (TPR) repeat protein